MQRRRHRARASLAVPVTTRKPAPCVHVAASRHVAWRAQGSDTRARRSRAARTARWRRSPGRAQGMAGDACVSLQAPPPKVATQVSGGTRWSCRIDGDARTKHRVRAQTPRRSYHPEVAPDASILRQAQNRYVAADALASVTEAT